MGFFRQLSEIKTVSLSVYGESESLQNSASFNGGIYISDHNVGDFRRRMWLVRRNSNLKTLGSIPQAYGMHPNLCAC